MAAQHAAAQHCRGGSGNAGRQRACHQRRPAVPVRAACGGRGAGRQVGPHDRAALGQIALVDHTQAWGGGAHEGGAPRHPSAPPASLPGPAPARRPRAATLLSPLTPPNTHTHTHVTTATTRAEHPPAVALNLAQLVALANQSRFSRRKESTVVPQCISALANTVAPWHTLFRGSTTAFFGGGEWGEEGGGGGLGGKGNLVPAAQTQLCSSIGEALCPWVAAAP